MGMTKEDQEVFDEAANLIDINQIVAEQIYHIQTSDFHWIKMGEEQIRLFKSLSNRRLEDKGETFGEYRVRQKINNQMIKLHKKGGTTPNNI
jgi:hypothetical protein